MKFKMTVFKDHGDETVLSDPDKEFDSIDRAHPNKKPPPENYARVIDHFYGPRTWYEGRKCFQKCPSFCSQGEGGFRP